MFEKPDYAGKITLAKDIFAFGWLPMLFVGSARLVVLLKAKCCNFVAPWQFTVMLVTHIF